MPWERSGLDCDRHWDGQKYSFGENPEHFKWRAHVSERPKGERAKIQSSGRDSRDWYWKVPALIHCCLCASQPRGQFHKRGACLRATYRPHINKFKPTWKIGVRCARNG